MAAPLGKFVSFQSTLHFNEITSRIRESQIPSNRSTSYVSTFFFRKLEIEKCDSISNRKRRFSISGTKTFPQYLTLLQIVKTRAVSPSRQTNLVKILRFEVQPICHSFDRLMQPKVFQKLPKIVHPQQCLLVKAIRVGVGLGQLKNTP